jgi:hypothetical protein
MKKAFRGRCSEALLWLYLVVGGVITYAGMVASCVDAFRAIRRALGF